MIPAALLLFAAAAWTIAFHGVPLRSLPFLVVVVAAAAWCQASRWRSAVVLRDVVALAGGAVAVVLEPATLPLAVAVVGIVLGQPQASGGLLALAGASLVLLGHQDLAAASLQRGAWWLTAALIAAVALEAWEAGGRPRRRSRWRAWSCWVLVPVVASVVIGTALGLPLAQRPVIEQPVRRPDRQEPPPGASGLTSTLAIGAQRDIPTDPQEMARLDYGQAPPEGMVYLRAQTLPRCELVGNRLRWRAEDDEPKPWHVEGKPPGRWLGLWRRAGGGDAVWRPDGARWCDLVDLRQTEDGNWYRAGLGQQDSLYRVGLANSEGVPATADEIAVARRYPVELAGLPWDGIEDRAWGALAAEDAAEAVAIRLAARCTYALTGLPEPAAGPAGALRRFLFDPELALRRGHCQYFATAATLLLRRAGHPARVVIGFASDESDARRIIFRALHAHAWIEVVGRAGTWVRADPTPPTVRQAVTAAAAASVPPPPPVPPVEVAPVPVPVVAAPGTVGTVAPLPKFAPVRSWWWAVVLLILPVAVLWWRRRQPASVAARRAAAEQEALAALARDLGLRVTRRTTLSELAAALSQRTGINLDEDLTRHLRAIYGHGPEAPPWPLERLRAAARQRSGTPGA